MATRPIDHHRPLAGREAAAVAAAVAAALGELHEAGLVHGALGPDRVLVDDAGAGAVALLPAADPVEREARPADDVAALGDLFVWLAERAPDRPVGTRGGLLRTPHPAELLTELAHRCRAPGLADRPTARRVADLLHRRVPDARPPSATPAEPARLPAARRLFAHRRATLGSAAVVALVAAAAPADCSPSPAVATDPGPPAHAARWSDGVLTIGTRRYAVGDRGDHVLVAPWHCGPPSVALLRRATGEVVAFDRFPDRGHAVTGRVLARVPDGRRLVARRAGHGCPDLAVASADGRTIPVTWKDAS